MNEQEMRELDWAVAQADGRPDVVQNKVLGACIWRVTGTGQHWETYNPTVDPAEAMRLLEKYGLSLYPQYEVESKPHKLMHWCAVTETGRYRDERRGHIGETPCIAICRAVVALKAAS